MIKDSNHRIPFCQFSKALFKSRKVLAVVFIACVIRLPVNALRNVVQVSNVQPATARCVLLQAVVIESRRKFGFVSVFVFVSSRCKNKSIWHKLW